MQQEKVYGIFYALIRLVIFWGYGVFAATQLPRGTQLPYPYLDRSGGEGSEVIYVYILYVSVDFLFKCSRPCLQIIIYVYVFCLFCLGGPSKVFVLVVPVLVLLVLVFFEGKVWSFHNHRPSVGAYSVGFDLIGGIIYITFLHDLYSCFTYYQYFML